MGVFIFLMLAGILAIIFILLLMADNYQKKPDSQREKYKTFKEDREKRVSVFYRQKENRNKIFEGKRGGRYTEDKTKDGRPYRRYF